MVVKDCQHMIQRKPLGKTDADLAMVEEKVEVVSKAYVGKLKLL